MKRKRSFWKWLNLSIRAAMIEEIRKKRINREMLETYMRIIEERNREAEKEDGECFGHPSADESSTVGYFGSDSGDGSVN